MNQKEGITSDRQINNQMFAKNIRFLRKILGMARSRDELSQYELAQELGITRRTVISWENGNVPHQPNLQMISNFFSTQLEHRIAVRALLSLDLSEEIHIISKDEYQFWAAFADVMSPMMVRQYFRQTRKDWERQKEKEKRPKGNLVFYFDNLGDLDF